MEQIIPTPQSPCYKCEDRYVGCHGKCNKYADFRILVDECRERERNEADRYLQDYYEKKRAGFVRRR